MAIAEWARPRVAEYPGRQEAFGPAHGISEGKLSKLLRGVSPWTLEDVDTIVRGLGDDPATVLASLHVVRRQDDYGPAAERRDSTDEADYEGA